MTKTKEKLNEQDRRQVSTDGELELSFLLTYGS